MRSGLMRGFSSAAVILFFIISVGLSQTKTEKPGQRNIGLSPIESLPSSAHRYALIIGVDKYEDGKISALTGATNDAKTLAETLINYAGFPRDQVMLLTNDQTPERQPKRNIILAALANLAAAARRDQGLLLISFAGHGIERANRPFLLSSDAQLGNENDLDLLEDTAISVTKIKDRLKGIDQVLLILDACRNDPNAGRGSSSKPLTDNFMRSFNFDVKNREVKAFATLYATQPGEVSYEYREKQQGYFTYALVEALKGRVPGLANARGEITLGRLTAYLQDRVPKLVALNGGRQQRPNLVVDGYKPEQLVISVVININNNSTDSTAGELAVELEFWRSVEKSDNANELREYLKRYPNGRFVALANERISRLERVDRQPERLSIPRFPDSTDGLRRFCETIYLTTRDGERTKANQLIKTLALPNYQSWFKEVFGNEKGDELIKEYQVILGVLEPEITKLFDKMVGEGQSVISVVRIEQVGDRDANGYQKEALSQMKKPVALYSVRMTKPGEQFGQHIYSFIYLDGGFRLVGTMRALKESK